jgi:hypothetical protein
MDGFTQGVALGCPVASLQPGSGKSQTLLPTRSIEEPAGNACAAFGEIVTAMLDAGFLTIVGNEKPRPWVAKAGLNES